MRASLQNWCWITAAAAGEVLATIYFALGIVDGETAVLFGAATALYLVESVLRLLLMAVLRFWSLAVVDLTSLGGRARHLGGRGSSGLDRPESRRARAGGRPGLRHPGCDRDASAGRAPLGALAAGGDA